MEPACDGHHATMHLNSALITTKISPRVYYNLCVAIDKTSTRGKKNGWRENEREHVRRGKHYEQNETKKDNE